jgi:hypothetical protein
MTVAIYCTPILYENSGCKLVRQCRSGVEFGYASPCDAGMSAGDLYGASASARAEEQHLGSAGALYDAATSAGAELLSTTRHVIYTAP